MLLETIGDSMENRLIDFLIEGKGISYTKKDIADGCDMSRPTVYKILPNLIRQGIIKITRKIGRITLYALNAENEKVKTLLKLEEMLLKKSFGSVEQKSVLPVPQNF